MSMATPPTQDVFELTLGRAVLTDTGEHDALVHVWWRIVATEDRMVQVYVNDELVDVTDDPAQRDAWLIVDRARTNRIELLAVSMTNGGAVGEARADMLGGWSPRVVDRAEVALLRDEALPVDTRIAVSVDGAVVADRPLWPGDVPRSGFGGLFGVGGFGRDAASAPGLGRGELGHGPLGIDATAWRWSQAHLPPGPHTLALTAQHRDGQAISPPLNPPPLVADALPEPAYDLAIDTDFTLTWTD